MGENSAIEWTHHTFNPWHGCVKVSDGCKHCYAETLDKRFGPSHWGKGSARKMMGENYWKQPIKWNRDAIASGERRRVFCASMADVFEDRPDLPELDAARARLFALIAETPGLDWLLLTKRPENVTRMTPQWAAGWPENVWLGTSVENQEAANTRIPKLLEEPAAVHFLSCEPLLGPVDLNSDSLKDSLSVWVHKRLDWVIVGGESGPGARPMHPEWARGLRDQCLDLGIRFHFKQWGEYHYRVANGVWPDTRAGFCDHLPSVHMYPDGSLSGSNPETVRTVAPTNLKLVGKKRAGRLLDSRTWDEVPQAVRR